MYLFNRSISVSVRSEDQKIIIVDGTFLDTHHEMCLTLQVDLESYTIISANGELIRTPHLDCKIVKERINELRGINLSHNVRKQIQAVVGLEEGCTHLTDLALECVKGLVQAKFRLMHLNMSPEELKIELEKTLNGGCLHYNGR